jgi:ABC-type uncharacterized transport system substrate-binding protein
LCRTRPPTPHRKPINDLAARYSLPVIHALRAAAVEGGLICLRRRSTQRVSTAAYAYRIFRGANPADLPVSCQPSSSW